MRDADSKSPNAPTHVIVGDGITALAFFEACLDRDIGAVTVIGRNATALGRGAAYAKGAAGKPWRYAYLLNSPADDIDPQFAAWLSQRWRHVCAVMAGRAPDWLRAAAPLVDQGDIYGVNAPREFYGDFMEETAEAIRTALVARGVRVTFLDDTAQALDIGPEGVVLRTAAGRALRADGIDIAPGGPSTLRIEGDDTAFSAPSVFGHEDRIAEHIRRGAEIFCIGGNAAMLDVLRLCQSLIPETALRFVACAPDGAVPAALVPRLPRKMTEPTLTPGHTTAETFLAEIRREIDRAEARGEAMREIRAGFRAHFLDHPLKTYLTDLDEARKVPGALRFWLRGGTRDTIFDLHRLIRTGTARMMTGKVRAVLSHDDGAEVILEDAAGRERRYKTDFVVNCAGAGPGSSFDPLTQDLIEKGFLERRGRGTALAVGAGLSAGGPRIRYLSPAVAEIGGDVMAMPLYDAHMLRQAVARATPTLPVLQTRAAAPTSNVRLL
ncbi:MAG: FAD/NAD(P)-binding protein [Pseudomonadota bacterium]